MSWNQAGPRGPGWASPYGYGPGPGFGGWGRPPGPRGPPPGFGGPPRPPYWGPYGGGPQMGFGYGYPPQAQNNFSSDEPGVPGEEAPPLPPGADPSQQQSEPNSQQSWASHAPVQFTIPGQRMPGFNPYPPQIAGGNMGGGGGGNSKKKNKKKKQEAAKLAAEASSCPDSIPTPPGPPPPPVPPPSTPSTSNVANADSGKSFGAIAASDWPESLKQYVSKCFSKCQTDVDKDQVEIILKGKITMAATSGSLWTKDWSAEPVPSTLSTDLRPSAGPQLGAAKRGKFSFPLRGGRGGFGSPSKGFLSGRKRRDSSSDESTGSSSKSSKKSKKSKANYGDNPNKIPLGKGKGLKSKKDQQGVPYFYSDGKMTLDSDLATHERKQKRAARFAERNGGSKKSRNSSLNLAASLNSQLLNDFEENSLAWEGLHIVGTSTDLEKRYFRLTAAPDPSLTRPPEILKRSLTRVIDKWKENQDYHYACDQLKSIRQDLTVQGIRDVFTIRVYETHARVALEKGDFTEFNQCQSQLRMLYQDIGGENRAEFTAYRILYYMYTKENLDLNAVLAELTNDDHQDECLSHALKLRTAWSLNNFHRFFTLYKKAPKMAGYLIDWFADRERKAALKIMIKAYSPTSLPVDFILKELAFDSRKDWIKFIEPFSLQFTDASQKAINCKASIAALSSM